MKKLTIAFFIAIVCLPLSIFAQIPVKTLVQISRAEDELRFDKTLEDLMKNADPNIRRRAALAAGRIGNEAAIPTLINLLENDNDETVSAYAAFAIGEIESIKGADAIIKVLQEENPSDRIRTSAVEAAGKIAAANVKDEKSKVLGETILQALDAEDKKRGVFFTFVSRGITAVLRARPANAETTLVKFLNYPPQVRADALNALTRLRAKNANEQARKLLQTDTDAIVRANSARVLGAAEDKDAFDLLLNAATADKDSRVRVSAIRAVGSLKDARAADKLLERGETLLADYKKSKFANPVEKSEILEIASALGRILPNTSNEKAVTFLRNFREADKFRSPETEIAFAQIAPKIYVDLPTFKIPQDSGMFFGFLNAAGAIYYAEKYTHGLSSFAQGFGAIAENQSADKETVKKAQDYILYMTAGLQAAVVFTNPEAQAEMNETSVETNLEVREKLKKEFEKFDDLRKVWINAFPDIIRALAKLKPERYEKEIADFLLNKPVAFTDEKDGKRLAVVFEEPKFQKKESKYYLLHKDAIVRATAAELMAEIKNIDSSPALRSAFDFAVSEDKETNDAQLAILDAIVKQNKETAKRVLVEALKSPDYLVRKRAADLVKQNDLTKDFSNIEKMVGMVKPYDAKTGTRLGQILNTEADYRRAVSRKNGSVKAVLTTEKGKFTIEFLPEAAPLTVDNFIKLAKSNYFNGVAVHRVVPNFVMQDGDPRGDGNGGPGWSIRDEINVIPYERGAVGMALSGPNTGGSQWFVTHSPQPHLDGGYTVFGKVNEADMKIVDQIVRGDKILSVKILEK